MSIQDLWLLPRNSAILMMKVYRKLISPLYGEVCKYYPSCSRYALESFQQRGLFIGIFAVLWRLMRCNPFSHGGIDDVPEQLKHNLSINQWGFIRPARRKAEH